MRIVMKSSPIREVNTNQMIAHRYGPGAVDTFAKDCRINRKICESAQETRASKRRHPIGTLVMQIPDVLYYQETLKEPGFWMTEEGRRRMAKMWDEYPDMRRMKAKRNPFGKIKWAPRVI